MLTVQPEELLDRLKLGVFDPADAVILEQTSSAEFIAELNAVYPCRYQERRVRDKWELGLARSLRFELAIPKTRRSFIPVLMMLPVFRTCLFLSGEADTITGISVSTRLVVRPIRKPFDGIALTTGRGFKLDHTVDGWHLKALGKRTVKLTDDFLKNRGWRFDMLQQFTPKP